MKTEVLPMLVLTRKCQEIVVVGGADGIEPLLKVTVLGIENAKVRLGFEASDDVAIHRFEVWERIRANTQTGGPTNNSDGPDWASNAP
jgi:carbon storage regulator